jgi:hypothetical protein
MAEQLPLVLKQVVAVIDERTTIICLAAAGQIQPLEEPFATKNGLFDHPPFHISCRDVVVPWMAGFVNEERAKANAELKRRPASERRKADPRFGGKAGPPAYDENRPVDAHGQLVPRPGGPVSQQPSVPGALPAPEPVSLLDEVAAPKVLTAEEIRADPRVQAVLDETHDFGGDHKLEAVAAVQGFDALPRVVDDAEVERIVAAGGYDMARGVGDEQYLTALMEGPYYGATGGYANGTYCYVRLKDGELSPVDAAMGRAGGAATRMTLDPSARVVHLDDLEIVQEQMLAEVDAEEGRPDSAGWRELLLDPGRLAAVLGYSAMLIPKYKPGTQRSIGEIVVLDRSKLVISGQVRR